MVKFKYPKFMYLNVFNQKLIKLVIKELNIYQNQNGKI